MREAEGPLNYPRGRRVMGRRRPPRGRFRLKMRPDRRDGVETPNKPPTPSLYQASILNLYTETQVRR